jgi:hypothetical protein
MNAVGWCLVGVVVVVAAIVCWRLLGAIYEEMTDENYFKTP